MPVKKSKLFIINNILLALIIVVNTYLIAIPFLPQLLFHVNQAQGRERQLEAKLQTPRPVGKSDNTPVGSANQLIVPSMLLNEPIVEGANMYRALDRGIWRWPGGSTPDKGGNTVLVGHRFTYTKPKGVFYFLNKVAAGDHVGVVWNDRTYVYRVQDVAVVKPDNTTILAATQESTLTMYTCTPLWLPKDRLVVTARLETSYE
jgi:sortase A